MPILESYEDIRGDYFHPGGPAKGCHSRVFTGTTDAVQLSAGQPKIYGVLIIQGAASAEVSVYDTIVGQSLGEENEKLVASVAGLPGQMDGFILPFPVAMNTGAVIQCNQSDAKVIILYLP